MALPHFYSWKAVAVILMAAVFSLTVCAFAQAGTPDTGWYDSTSVLPFAISTADELAGLAELVNGGNDFSGKIIVLGADINLAAGYGDSVLWNGGNGWIPIGCKAGRPFRGAFNGNNKSVTGLYISDRDSAGLFGVVAGGTVRNLRISGAKITGRSDVGGLAGVLGGGSMVNCYVTGDVKGDKNVGGLVGRALNCSVSDCYVSGDVAGGDNAGGLVGEAGVGGVVERSYAAGSVTGGSNVGGLAGMVFGGAVKNSAALNKSVSGVDFVGRVAGDARGGALSDNIAFAAMEILAGGSPKFGIGSEENHTDGLSRVASVINTDSTLGNRFTAAGGWVTAKGSLPGFGAAAAKPAYLAPQMRSVTFSVTGGNGALTASVIGGGSITSGNNNVDSGSVVVFTAAPSAGFWVKEWKIGVSAIPGNTNSVHSITVTAAATAVTAVTVEFEPVSTDQLSVNRVKDALTWAAIRGANTGDTNAVRKNLANLYQDGSFVSGCAECGEVGIMWASSNPAVISNVSGEVKRALAVDVPVTLTAAIARNITSAVLTFNLTALKKDSIPPNDILFGNRSVAYNGTPRSIADVADGEAKIAPGMNNIYTLSGADAFAPPTYIYEGVSFGPVGTPPVSAGAYKVTARIENGHYVGAKTVDFTITPKTIVSNMVMPLSIDARVYDGGAQTLGGPYGVSDALVPLNEGVDYRVEYVNNVNAGTASVNFIGLGNYGGTVSRTFAINKKTISIDTVNSHVAPKAYDGMANVDTSAAGMRVEFSGLVSGETLKNVKDYVIINAVFTGSGAANITDSGTVTATINLVTAGETARNYTLANPPIFRITGVPITKKTADAGDFTFTIPRDHLYTGTARGIGGVTLKSPRVNPGGTLTILYGDTTIIPAEIGSYDIKVRLSGGSNFNDAVTTIGTYIIDAPVKPEIVSQTPDTTVRQGAAARLSVTAVSPNGGTLSYRWYRNDTLIAGASGASYQFTPAAIATVTYRVTVINSKPGVQVPDSTLGGKITVRVLPPLISIASAVVTVGGEYVYTGNPLKPEVSDMSVVLGGVTLLHGKDYTYTVSNNLNAGRALVTVQGADNYGGTAVSAFQIGLKTLEASDLEIVQTAVYNAAARPVTVILTDGRTGLGAVTATYSGSAAIPSNAGSYEIVITSVSRGTNFTALTEPVQAGTYTIEKKAPVQSDLVYTIPTGHIWTGGKQGIGSVTVKGTGYGKVTVLYNSHEDLPIDSGSYNVTAVIEGGGNYLAGVISLGVYRIAPKKTVAITSNERIVPQITDERAAVIPNSGMTGVFSAGPNLAARTSGGMEFFWQGKALSGGYLLVFDALGNIIGKINIVDNGIGGVISGSRRKIGSWNLKDAKGRPVSAGTYLIRGVIYAAGGSKEEVSRVIGVR